MAVNPPRLAPGDPAPDFDLPTSDGGRIRRDDLKGSKAVVFCYPAAGTPACTAEADEFRDAAPALLGAGYHVVGVSPDSVEKLAAFAREERIAYPLASDPDHRMLESYGAWGAKVLYGREVTGVIRSTYILDEKGRVLFALGNVRAKGHVERVLRLLGV